MSIFFVGYARLFAEKLCFSVSLDKLIAAMPQSGGIASKKKGNGSGEAELHRK